MSDWEPQVVFALWIVTGLLLSVSGALLLEKWIQRLANRKRRNGFTVIHVGKEKSRQPLSADRQTRKPEQE